MLQSPNQNQPTSPPTPPPGGDTPMLVSTEGESQRMLFTLLSNLPGMAYRCKNQQDWAMEFVSQGCLALTGYQPVDLLAGGKVSYGALIDPLDQPLVFEQVQVALRQKQPFQLTYRITRADGTRRWVWEQGCGIWDTEGHLVALEGFISDITEQKQAQEHLQESLQALQGAQAETEAERHLWHSLLIQAPSLISIVSGEEHVLEFVNPLLSELLGNRLQVGQPLRDSLVGLPATAFLAKIEHVYRTGETLLVKEMPLTVPVPAAREEAEIYHNILFKALPNATGDARRVLIFGNDVTEQVLARMQVQASETRIRHMLDTIPQIIWTIPDIKQNVAFFNQRWYEYTGLSEEQSLGMGWQQVVHAEDWPLARERRHQGQVEGQAYGLECRLRRRDGSYCWHLARVVPMYEESGQILLWIGTATNIHEQKTTQQALEQTLQELHEKNFELEEKNYELDQFVYKTSHDLRSPLSTILGLVDLLKQEDDQQTKAHYVDLIENRIHKLDRFIRSMLDYSRTSRTAAAVEKIELATLLKECWQGLEYLKHFARLSLTVEVSQGEFYSDSFRIKIIFSNLISNAIKYQDFNKPESKLLIRVALTHEQAVIEFSDNGVGIDEKYQEKIFGMFVRAAEQAEGSGLGLYIVKQAVGGLNGSIQMESRKGIGTRFLVSLPNKLPSGLFAD